MNIVLGGGLSGLAAGYTFARSGIPTTVLEKETSVGGLARTISHGDYRFDLGGHRFLSDRKSLNDLVAGLLGDDLLTVPRTSQIYMGGNFYNYPLTPKNAIFGLGVGTSMRILLDYGREKLTTCLKDRNVVSLEDWVVAKFGRAMFNLYFKEYSEKVWGIRCNQINMDWVAKRIDGLSLGQTIKHAFFRSRKTKVKTLTDSFLYPRYGIGQIADQLKNGIVRNNEVKTDASITKVLWRKGRIEGVVWRKAQKESITVGENYISSIPLTVLLDKMDPKPPYHVLKSCSEIRFRSLVIVVLMLDREKVSDLTWMYLPGKEIPFGRVHEPKNWSCDMAPEGKTHIVAEYFCDRGDAVWNSSDDELAAVTTAHLQSLGFFTAQEVEDRCVLRIPHAYPLFNVGYEKHVKVITDYLDQISNLHLVGRSGLYSYLNMDHAMESGIRIAEQLLLEVGECAVEYDKDCNRLEKKRALAQNPLPLQCESYA